MIPAAPHGAFLPVMLRGAGIRAVVVGGGQVATRKVATLITASVSVHVVARVATAQLLEYEDDHAITLRIGEYRQPDIADATLVIAATNSPAVNSEVVADARALGRLVLAVDAPEQSSFVLPAVHVAGHLHVAVVAGAPRAATRIRDEIAARFDTRYATALDALARLRSSLLKAGRTDQWRTASAQLLGPEFCASIERGDLNASIDQWR